MAKSSRPNVLQPAKLTIEQIKIAIRKLDRRIAEIKDFNPENVNSFSDPGVASLTAAIKSTLDSIFGTGSSDVEIFSDAENLYNGSIWAEMSQGDYAEGYQNGKDKSLSLLIRAKELLNENVEDIEFLTQESQSDGLEFVTIRGRLDIADPPKTSAYRYNKIDEELPETVAQLTSSLTTLVDAVKGDNSLFAEVLKKQLVILLETTAAELKSPFADTGKIRKAANTIRSVGENAASKGAERFLVDKFNKVAEGLADFVQSLL